MDNETCVRTFRDELDREWEVRAIRDALTARRQRLRLSCLVARRSTN